MGMKKSCNKYITVIWMSLCLAGCAGSGTSAAAGHAAGGDHVTGADYAAGGDHAGDEELVIYCPNPLEFINPIV